MKNIDLCIVSGSSRGIGSNIIKNLSHISKTIIGMSSLNSDIEQLPNKECKLYKIHETLSNYNEIRLLVRDSCMKLKYTPKTVGVVLCGASLGDNKNIFDALLEDWEDLYKCNVLGNLAVIKSIQTYIENGAKTRIVFFAGGGAAGPFEFGGYAASKAAVVRTVENLGVEFEKKGYDASIIALAPGFIPTDMGKKVIEAGSKPKTQTEISEPTDFVRKFLTDEFDAKKLNGHFLHCRDQVDKIDWNKKDILKLRRIE